jgi:hypothetical protein
MTTGLGRAQETAASADNTAQRIARRTAAAGFAGTAQSMVRVREAIGEIQASIAAVAETVTKTRGSVAAAPKQPSTQETTSVLASVEQALNWPKFAAACRRGLPRT